MGYSATFAFESAIPEAIEWLEESKKPYKVVDLVPGDLDRQLRRQSPKMLVTEMWVYLEKAIDDPDCDGHSTIKSVKYKREELIRQPIKKFCALIWDWDAKKVFVDTSAYNPLFLSFSSPNHSLLEQSVEALKDQLQRVIRLAEDPTIVAAASQLLLKLAK